MFFGFTKRFLNNVFKHSLTGLLLLTYVTIGSCGTIPSTKEGEITGGNRRMGWTNDTPHGMVLVPTGTFLMGGGVNQGVIAATNMIQSKTITKFYMDAAEVTNAQYREFITIVRADPETYGLNEAYINEKLIPDMTVWERDFSSMFMGDALIESYYGHPSFDDYPVVGITWEAAKEYARVRSIYRNNYLKSKGLSPAPSFRLPTAAEWEYAAKGGQPCAQYPWGGPTVRDQKGRLLANFQVTKGNYAESGYTYTAPVKTFPPNDYGLYDMSGNVSEWCEDVYSPLLTHKSGAINPVYRDEKENFRVIKGGSWKDFAYALQTGICDCEHKDVARSYIGFRCVMSAI